jgi:SWI/SNF-related matrix-associated actin-dependent regulator 1 of chromatin subfamily A
MAEPWLRYAPELKTFWWAGPFESRHLPKKAGFEWRRVQPRGDVFKWLTRTVYIAKRLSSYADPVLKGVFTDLENKDTASRQVDDTLVSMQIPYPPDQEPYPFQLAGAEHIVRGLRSGLKGVLLADEQGLGKTIQAILVANTLNARNPLVVCPASVRSVWKDELATWHLGGTEPQVITSGKQKVDPNRTLITSYGLAHRAREHKPDLVIMDEVHYCKHPMSRRSQIVLGELGPKAPTIMMTGTPSPNRAHELWAGINAVAPQIIDQWSQFRFTNHFCRFDAYSERIVGARNAEELAARLRCSGFMTRRVKRDVLHDLPEKTYRMVTLEPDGKMAEILEKEAAFDVKEILRHGVPVGTAIPGLRHEMGVAKVPYVVRYVRELLSSGAKKVLVFAYHRDVIETLARELNGMMIHGSISAAKRAETVKRFQDPEGPAVLVGQTVAAGVGLTLTAACDVVFAETSWVPGEDEQCEDRAHRIGQTRGVIIHQVVVRGSIDAMILSVSASKRKDIRRIMQ